MDAMVSSGVTVKKPQLWQFPLFIFSVGLFGYAAYLFIDPKPGPTVNDHLKEARKYLEKGRSDPALEILKKVLTEETLEPRQEGAVRMMMAEGLDVWQKEQHVSVPKNYRQIIDQMKMAGNLGIKPDAKGIELLGRSYEALGRAKDSLAQYQQLEAMGGDQHLKWLRKVIELELLLEQREQASAALEKFLEVSDLAAGERAWALGEKAHIQIDQGEFAVGRELMLQAIKLTDLDEPASPRSQEIGEYRYWLGYCAWKMGDHSEAEKQLRVSRDLLGISSRLDGDAAFLLGKLREIAKDLNGALSFYNEVILTHADSMTAQSARLARGLCRIKKGSDEAGLTDLTDTVRWMRGREQVPDKIREEILKSLAAGSEALVSRGNCDGGLELMEMEQQLFEKPTAEFWGRLARLHERQAVQLEASIKEKETPELKKKLAETRSKAGDAYIAWSRELVLDDKGYGDAMWKGIAMYEASGNLPRVISALETFTKQRPEDSKAPEAWFRLGQAYHASGQFDKAIDTYKRLQFLYVRSLPASKAGVPMARAYIAKGPDFYPSAEQTLKMVIDDNPQIEPEANEFREAMAELASLFYRTARYERAIVTLEEMTQRYPNDERLGQMYFLMGDSYRKSASILDTRLAMTKGAAPTSRPSFNLEEATAARKSRLEDAVRAYKTVIDIYKATPPRTDIDRLYEKMAFFYRADCVYDLGQYSDAIKLYDEAAFRYQDDSSALAATVQIVNAYVALGKPEEAKAANERAKWMLLRMERSATNKESMAMSLDGYNDWFQWSTKSGLWKN